MENDIYRLDEKINGDGQVDIIDYTNKLADSIQKKIDDIIMSGDTNAEVVDARGEFNTLGNRLDNVDKNIVISTKPFETNCDIEDSANSKIKFDKIIGGLVQETRDGYNLFNVNDTNTVSSGITVDEEDWITITCDNSSGTSIIYQNYFTNNLNLKENTNYNIIAEIKKVSGTGSIQIVSNSSTSQFNQSIGYLFSDLSNGRTVQLNKLTKSNFTNTTQGIRTFCSFNAGESGSITFRISVLEDTTITSDNFVYVKFGKSPSINYPSELKYVGGNYDIEVNNKNLFKLVDKTFTSQGVTTIVKDGLISCSGTVTHTSFDIGKSSDLFETNVLANTNYIFSRTKSSKYRLWIRFFTKDKIALEHFMIPENQLSIPVNISQNARYYYMWMSNVKSGDTISVEEFGVQVEKGEIATDYIKHQEQIYPLDLTNHPLYSEKDYIYKKDNKWYVHNEFDRYDFTGLEQWSKHETTKNNAFYLAPLHNPIKDKMKLPENANTVLEIYSNRLLTDTLINTVFSNNEKIAFSSTGDIYIGTTLNGISTIDDLKTFLQNNPTYMIYPLATPTETEIQGESAVVEAELLYTQLEAIYNMKTYKGGTHITFDDIGKIQGDYIVDNGLAEAVREFNEINGYVDEARVIELIKQYK